MRLNATPKTLNAASAPLTPASANQERRGWLKKLGAALGLGIMAGPAAAARGTRGTLGVQGPDGDYIGQIILFAGSNWQLQNYLPCNGQLLPINQYTALFSVIGPTYGGNGRDNFALPDLRGRVPMGAGQGPGLSNYNVGQAGGTETVTLTAGNLPTHTHWLNVAAGAATTATASGNFPAAATGQTAGGENLLVNSFNTAGGAIANSAAISPAGSSLPYLNMPPHLAMTYYICVNGYYPVRS
ncbi:phage tail protein [Hymenobacter yonginensis]|uniref:Tail fiber protein n=1 Tax=Hymenobacter yonginensis TaxID=748197 RepID=A0ABY7PMG5_9BACT|nr:tail fiber protein [Hymenobacter yonginensis]WBO84438.1 tail fiber protein [Hymenobacter yonginensis]